MAQHGACGGSSSSRRCDGADGLLAAADLCVLLQLRNPSNPDREAPKTFTFDQVGRGMRMSRQLVRAATSADHGTLRAA